MVERAGRAPAKPATYASLKVAKVSMSVRKHNVLAMSFRVHPCSFKRSFRFLTACVVCADTPPATSEPSLMPS